MCSISVNSPFGFMMINMSEWRFMSVAGSFCSDYKSSYVNIICFMALLHVLAVIQIPQYILNTGV